MFRSFVQTFTKLNDRRIHSFNRFSGDPPGSSISSCMNALLSAAIQSSVFDSCIYFHFFTYLAELAIRADMAWRHFVTDWRDIKACFAWTDWGADIGENFMAEKQSKKFIVHFCFHFKAYIPVYPAYIWSLRWVYAVKKNPEVGIRRIPAYTPPPIHHWAYVLLVWSVCVCAEWEEKSSVRWVRKTITPCNNKLTC